MSTAETSKLIDFFRSEVTAEAKSGFARLSRVPDSRVQTNLETFQLLDTAERAIYLDCCAHWAASNYAQRVGLQPIDRQAHPYFEDWMEVNRRNSPLRDLSVQHFRRVSAMCKGLPPDGELPRGITQEVLGLARTANSIKAPELRKRARQSLLDLGYQRKVDAHTFLCEHHEMPRVVHIDCGSRAAQLRYSVSLVSGSTLDPGLISNFEESMGFGFGWWDYIIDENVEAVFELFRECVEYCFSLPARVDRALAS